MTAITTILSTNEPRPPFARRLKRFWRPTSEGVAETNCGEHMSLLEKLNAVYSRLMEQLKWKKGKKEKADNPPGKNQRKKGDRAPTKNTWEVTAASEVLDSKKKISSAELEGDDKPFQFAEIFRKLSITDTPKTVKTDPFIDLILSNNSQKTLCPLFSSTSLATDTRMSLADPKPMSWTPMNEDEYQAKFEDTRIVDVAKEASWMPEDEEYRLFAEEAKRHWKEEEIKQKLAGC
ncbi:hypothetical protein BC829DRAFT_37536 [Chytridium lagenaria]|nr:hypothetical protein BC829DRAFT_37536 [Chytridium lagenaria]